MILEGGISKNYTQNWDKTGNIYYTDENGQVVDFKVNPFVKLANKVKATATNIGDWINETNPNSEAYKQKVSAIVGLETLPLGLGATLTGGIAKGLTPYVGRKIAQNMATGASSGVAGGAVTGGLEAGLNDRNIGLGTLNGGFWGLLGGLGGGYGLGKVAQKFERAKLPNNTVAQEQYFNDYVADLNNKTKAMADFRAGKIGVKKGGNGKLYNFIGKNSYFGNPSKIREAELMNALGEEPEKIFEETGWFKGVDGKWRKEIPDGNLIENPNLIKNFDDDIGTYYTGELSDIYDAPELYKAYPQLARRNVVIQDMPEGISGSSIGDSISLSKDYYTKQNPEFLKLQAELESSPEYKKYNAAYNIDTGNPVRDLEIIEAAEKEFFNSDIGKKYHDLMWDKNYPIQRKIKGWSNNAKDTLVHELQHQIQGIEDFARGGSGKNPNYRNLAGEVEARMAERRANLTPEQREIYKPFGDAALLSNYGYDVLPEKQVIEFAKRLNR